jgi:hypothetical protein
MSTPIQQLRYQLMEMSQQTYLVTYKTFSGSTYTTKVLAVTKANAKATIEDNVAVREIVDIRVAN